MLTFILFFCDKKRTRARASEKVVCDVSVLHVCEFYHFSSTAVTSRDQKRAL